MVPRREAVRPGSGAATGARPSGVPLVPAMAAGLRPVRVPSGAEQAPVVPAERPLVVGGVPARTTIAAPIAVVPARAGPVARTVTALRSDVDPASVVPPAVRLPAAA